MFKAFLFGLTIGGVGSLLAMQYHIVRTNERFVIVSRAHQPPLRSVYVDVRGWNPVIWQSYPELHEAIIKAGREDLIDQTRTAESKGEKTAAAPAAQLVDVNRTGPTPIFTASESRSLKNDRPISSYELDVEGHAFSDISSPMARNTTALSGMNAVRLENSPVPSAGEPAFPTIQKTVPSPMDMELRQLEITPHPPVAAAPQSRQRSPQQGDWVQSLIKSVVTTAPPSETYTESTSAGTSSRANETEPIAYPQTRTVPPQDEASFPSSPRRIPVANGQLN